MRIYNSYILALVIAFSLVTILMALREVEETPAYFSAYALIFLSLTILFVYFNPRARRTLNTLGLAVFAGFLSVVILTKISAIILAFQTLWSLIWLRE